MPDLAMCADYECPSRSTCYRYRAHPNAGRQAYADFSRNERDPKCGSYYPMELAKKPEQEFRTTEEVDEQFAGFREQL